MSVSLSESADLHKKESAGKEKEKDNAQRQE
jgi:hypothetical protein